MKTLNDYIIDEELNYISNSVRKYIYINNIFNNLHITVNEQLLLEGSGLYKGCYDLAKYINSIVFNSEDNEIIIDTKKLSFANIFTKKIILKIDRNSNENYAGYVFANKLNKNYNKERWSEKENIFNFIEIKLNFNTEQKTIIDLIIHELDHAYDDYQNYKNNGTTYEYKYINCNYSVFDKNKSDDNFTFLVKYINYMFIKFETHAYISQIRGEINKKFNNISEAYDFIETKSEVWKMFKIIKNNAEYILQNKKYAEKYCKVYKNITNTKKTNSKIINELEYNLNRQWKKIINHVYLLLIENCINENNITTIPSTNKLYEKLKKLSIIEKL